MSFNDSSRSAPQSGFPNLIAQCYALLVQGLSPSTRWLATLVSVRFFNFAYSLRSTLYLHPQEPRGIPDHLIKTLGRWSSNTYQTIHSHVPGRARRSGTGPQLSWGGITPDCY